MTLRQATVFAPATIGNVGPGFDVLGLAVEGLGDEVGVTLGVEKDSVECEGRDAAAIPREPSKNAAWVAAHAYLRSHGEGSLPIAVSLKKGLPLSGGMGGSAASSVGGALAAALAMGRDDDEDGILEASLEGEKSASSGHWDNLAPCLLGGLCLVRSDSPRDIVRLPVPEGWWLALVTPDFKLETRRARSVLPEKVGRDVWVWQMAQTASLVAAFLQKDAKLAGRALRDLYAEPARAPLIPQFDAVKRAALESGALGATISGAGPTVFALCDSKDVATRAGAAMQTAFGPLAATVHVGGISTSGARRVTR